MKPQLQSATPVLRITSAEQAREFYLDGLDFEVDWEWRHEPGFPVFMSVTRGAVTLFLSEHSGDVQPGGAVYLRVDDVDSLYQEVTSRGISVRETPQIQPWGLKECVIEDPFSNRLTFATAIQETAAE